MKTDPTIRQRFVLKNRKDRIPRIWLVVDETSNKPDEDFQGLEKQFI